MFLHLHKGEAIHKTMMGTMAELPPALVSANADTWSVYKNIP